MEKYQLERREKIAAGILLAVIAAKAAVYTKRGNKLGHARDYPAGSFIIEVLDLIDEGRQKSIRISGKLLSLNSFRLEVDDAEHTDADLDEVETVFRANSEPDSLQNG